MAEDVKLNENRPRLKKVKRPKRPQQDANQGIMPQKSEFNAPVRAVDAGEYNLDSYLDYREVEEAPKGRFVTDEDVKPVKAAGKFRIGNLYTLNMVVLVGIGLFIFGILTAKLLFSGDSVVQDGLQGVVINPEVPRGRARCGVAETEKATRRTDFTK